MRKSLTLLTLLTLLMSTLHAQVLFDPSTYPADSLRDGMEIVDMDGTKYLKVALNGWGTSFPVDSVIVAPGHTRLKADVSYILGDGAQFTLDQIRTFVQPFSVVGGEWEARTQISLSPSVSEIRTLTIDGMVGADTIIAIQLAGQETEGWTAIVGDTILLGKVVAEHPDAIIDPLLVPQDSLPANR